MNGASAPVTATRPRRLVLHFDINKTIVMKDTTNNVNNSTLTTCNILANLVWGRMVTKKVGQVEEAQWQYVSDQLTEVRPALEDQSEVLSFREYLDRFFPQKSA
jgi:hypothetical protein